MSSNKIDFINDLLSSKKIKIDEKNKILELTKSELMNFDVENSEIKRRINNIEIKINKLEGKQSIEKSNRRDKLSSNIAVKFKKHSPKTMVKFLYSFSIDEKFKWFTHTPEGLEMPFDHKNYIISAKSEFDKATGWNINNGTYYNVRNFIYDAGDKYSKINDRLNLMFSWRDAEKWCMNNPGTHPYFAEIDGNLFKRYIGQFKQLIAFRTDDTDLTFNIRVRKLIRQLLGVDFEPVFTESFNAIGQSVHIYCDTDLLFSAIKQMTEWILDNKSKSNAVAVDLVDFEDYYQLEITHKNSYLSISPADEKLNGLSGDFDKVRKLLFSVADWEMIATLKFNSLTEHYRINCIDSETKLAGTILTPMTMTKETDNQKPSIKHVLRLYKTRNL